MTEQNDKPGVIAFPPLILLAAIAVAAALEWTAPLGLFPSAMSAGALVSGGAATLIALFVALSGIHAFKRAGTNVEPFKPALVLVEDGPYRFTRNPMYIGLLLLFIGIGLIASLDWTPVVLVPFWLVLHLGVVLREERYLDGKFGEPYRAYLARTRRWLW